MPFYNRCVAASGPAIMIHAIRVIAALLLAPGLSGCGQSGPLYIPGDPSQVQTPPAATASGAEEDEAEDEDRK